MSYVYKTYYNKYERDSQTRKLYGKTWKRIRDRYIAKHSLCEECRKSGKLTPAEEVHHIIPLSQGGTNEDGDLMSLCARCHSAITAKKADAGDEKRLPCSSAFIQTA
ncbi:MAG: HNH endonuclease [Syntrophomonadaceae bacterium]|nr:HNH endonuclease [Syntrophomonadaceae bacterium]